MSHPSICSSPIGNALRAYLRVCPALATCTTIDWYDEWPLDALQAVASASLNDLPDVSPAQLEKMVHACVHHHVTTRALADRYDEELRRVVHVTPTHYLELLALLRSLLVEERREVSAKKERFDMGWRRLRQSAESVVDLQQELEEAGERQRGIDRLIEVENQKLKGLAVLSPRPS